MKFNNSYNYPVDDASFYEENSGDIQTVPDSTLTVRDMLIRHTRGLAPPVAKTPIYEYFEDGSDNHDFDDFPEKANDLTEVQEQLAVVNSRIRSKAKTAKEKKLSPDNERQDGNPNDANKLADDASE